MAQVLKDEQRNSIIEAAKTEFVNKGYKDTTMRSIAKNANMTVGNLYRYFKNKESIHYFIVTPCLKLLDEVLRELTSNTVSMQTRVFNIEVDTDSLKGILDRLADQLVDIYKKHSLEFNLVMMQSELNDKIIDWFSGIILTIIDQKYGFIEDREKWLLAHSYAVSICRGLSDMFKNASHDANLNKLVKIYFRSYILMLDNDLRKFVD